MVLRDLLRQIELIELTDSNTVLINCLDMFLGSQRVQPRPRGFHPSEISKCQRAIFYSFTEEASNPWLNPRIKRIMDNGNYMHARFTRYFEQMGILEAADVPLPANVYGVVGTIDGIVKIDGERYIFELKSAKNEKFKSIDKLLTDTGYLQQSLLYMYFMGIPRVIFLVENKDTQELAERILYLKDYEAELGAVLVLLDKMQLFVDQGITPDRKCTSRSFWLAKGCLYRDLCFDNQN